MSTCIVPTWVANQCSDLEREIDRLRVNLWSCREALLALVEMGYPGSDADAITMTLENARRALAAIDDGARETD